MFQLTNAYERFAVAYDLTLGLEPLAAATSPSTDPDPADGAPLDPDPGKDGDEGCACGTGSGGIRTVAAAGSSLAALLAFRRVRRSRRP